MHTYRIRPGKIQRTFILVSRELVTVTTISQMRILSVDGKYQSIDGGDARGRGAYAGKKRGESDLVGASHRRVTRTGRVVVEDRCA